ncbi:hypothetical protein GCM10027048_03670 [Hymenobacter coalescens]
MHLLNKQDAASVKKALEHFRQANQMTEYGNIAKPQVLYHLAYGNLVIGNIEQSFKIAHKAKRSINQSIQNSVFSSPSLAKMLGEDNIDSLIEYISANFFEHIFFINNEDDYFNENEIDFSNIHKLYPNGDVLEQKFINKSKLTDDIIFSTFIGQCRTNDQLIYFDKVKGDVVSYIDGYFSSHCGDQSIENRKLADKITNNAPTDFIDEQRHILIDRLLLSDFLSEYESQTRGLIPFDTLAKDFSLFIMAEFKAQGIKSTSELAFSPYMHEKFHNFFGSKYKEQANNLRDVYTKIFEDTCKRVAENWIDKNIFLKS